MREGSADMYKRLPATAGSTWMICIVLVTVPAVAVINTGPVFTLSAVNVTFASPDVTVNPVVDDRAPGARLPA